MGEDEIEPGGRPVVTVDVEESDAAEDHGVDMAVGIPTVVKEGSGVSDGPVSGTIVLEGLEGNFDGIGDASFIT